jgi:hypothetical protein
LSVAIVDIASLEVFGLRRRYMLTLIDCLGSVLWSSFAPSNGGLLLPETAIILAEATMVFLLCSLQSRRHLRLLTLDFDEG